MGWAPRRRLPYDKHETNHRPDLTLDNTMMNERFNTLSINIHQVLATLTYEVEQFNQCSKIVL